MQVIFTPLAARQLESLHEYIATHASESRADGYVGRIVALRKGLTTFPLRGTQRDDVLPGLRVTGFERRVTIAFAATEAAILIEGISTAGRISRRRSVTGNRSLGTGGRRKRARNWNFRGIQLGCDIGRIVREVDSHENLVRDPSRPGAVSRPR